MREEMGLRGARSMWFRRVLIMTAAAYREAVQVRPLVALLEGAIRRRLLARE